MTPTPISPAIIGEHEKFLLYGDAKMGKTFCALTIPEPIYFVTFMSDNEAKTYYSKEFQKSRFAPHCAPHFVPGTACILGSWKQRNCSR